MRFILALLLIWPLMSCAEPEPPNIERLEIGAPGLQIEINDRGHGRFEAGPRSERGQFRLSPARLKQLLRDIEPYRRSPETINDTKTAMRAFLESHPCPQNYATDQGHISFHWIGPGIDQWYNVNFGCHMEKNAERNQRLRQILASLPVPRPSSLP